MKILVVDWMGGQLLKGTPYAHKQELEGTETDALRIVGELFSADRNVMIHRDSSSNIVVAVDSKKFQQR